jgi:hypothetical protein
MVHSETPVPLDEAEAVEDVRKWLGELVETYDGWGRTPALSAATDKWARRSVFTMVSAGVFCAGTG